MQKNITHEKRKARHFRANPNLTGLPNCSDQLRHTDQCSRRTSRLCGRSCFGGQELPAACLEVTVTGLASVDVTAVYRHPPASTPETLRRVLPLRIVPWLPDTRLFMGLPLADVHDAMVPSSDQAPLTRPDLPWLLIVWVSHLYFRLGLKDSPRTLAEARGGESSL